MGNSPVKSVVSACLQAAISTVTNPEAASKSGQCVNILKYLAKLYTTLQSSGQNYITICEAAKTQNATSMLVQHQDMLSQIQWWQIVGMSTLVVIILLIFVNLIVHCNSVRNQHTAYLRRQARREAFAAREEAQTSPRLWIQTLLAVNYNHEDIVKRDNYS